MLIAALSWPEAVVASVSAATLGLFLSVVAWQIFSIGRVAVRNERRLDRATAERLSGEIEDLGRQLESAQSTPPQTSV